MAGSKTPFSIKQGLADAKRLSTKSEDAINKATNDGIDSSKVNLPKKKKVKTERSYADEIADKYRANK